MHRPHSVLGQLRTEGSQVEIDTQPARIGTLLSLTAGDLVYVSEPGGATTYEGVVEIIAPHLNVLWVQTTSGDRRLVVANECTIQRVGLNCP